MNIREVLERVNNRIIVPKPALPQQCRMVKVRILVEQRLDALYANPVGLDLDELHLRIRAAIATDHMYAISSIDWHYVPLCLLKGSPRLIEETKFIAVYLQRLAQQINHLAVKHLIRFYLIHFDPDIPGIRLIGEFLAHGVNKLGKEWSDRHHEVALFDPKMAPTRLANGTMEANESPASYLTRMGFDRSFAAARLAGYAFLEALKILRSNMTRQTPLEWIQKVTTWGMTEEKKFRYHGSLPGARGKLAEALLLPWVRDDPHQKVKEFSERFLLEHYKDLRINPSRWNDVCDEAKRVMRRWLTKASLDWFLNVVDETATDDASRRMWPARRKFWEAYYKNKYLEEAWVVFGRAGTECARRLSKLDQGTTSTAMSFGRLQSGGIMNNHAVLIMRIGDLTIADWNFNGKCHIWLGGNSKSPRLYGTGYDRNELIIESDFQQIHWPDVAWQRKVYDFILNHTRASMPRSEYI